MAKASAIEMRHAEAVKSINERLERLENMLVNGPLATVEAVEGEGLAVEGEPMWAFTDIEMQSLMSTVEQLCNKAGVPWETLDLANDQVDPMAHIQQRLAMVGDRVSPVEHQSAPVEAGTKHDDAPTPAPDTSGLKTKGK